MPGVPQWRACPIALPHREQQTPGNLAGAPIVGGGSRRDERFCGADTISYLHTLRALRCGYAA
jgi:hypothetical protein